MTSTEPSGSITSVASLRAAANGGPTVHDSLAGSNNWTKVVERRVGVVPPATRIDPFASSVAVWPPIPAIQGLVRRHDPVAESKNSAIPPASPTTTPRPSGNRVAVFCVRTVDIDPVAVHAFVAGSKISADVMPGGSAPKPPATRTRPSRSRVAVGDARQAIIGRVSDHVFVAGL